MKRATASEAVGEVEEVLLHFVLHGVYFITVSGFVKGQSDFFLIYFLAVFRRGASLAAILIAHPNQPAFDFFDNEETKT